MTVEKSQEEQHLERVLEGALERASAVTYVGHGPPLGAEAFANIKGEFLPLLCGARSWEEICALLDSAAERVLDARVAAWNAKTPP